MKDINILFETLVEQSLEKKPIDFKNTFNEIIVVLGREKIKALKESLRPTLFEDMEDDGTEVQTDNAIHASIHNDDTTGQ